MTLAFDSYYSEDKAKTVCLAFKDWSDSKPTNIYEEITSGIAEYEPGAFYKRELPCILSLLDKIKVCVRRTPYLNFALVSLVLLYEKIQYNADAQAL